MADIPPPIAGSAAQAGFQQAEVAKTRDALHAGQGETARRTARAIDDASATIETTDDDTAVFADAEGAGGQGRSPEEESGDATDADPSDEPLRDGITTDSNGMPHLDIQA